MHFSTADGSHSWLAGHLLEPQYSADWGDYASFVHVMRNRSIENEGVLLTVDTGDIEDGTGLSDASKVVGSKSRPLFTRILADLATVGNHELYSAETARAIYEEVVPQYHGRYIVANVKILDEQQKAMVPFANRSYYFVTENNIRILALGFLYDFTGAAHNLEVQSVESCIEEDWFREEMQRRDVDLYLVIGHASIRFGNEFRAIHQAIRGVHPGTPIQFFGGHTHTRDFRKYDDKSFALESGRYCETVGWVSLDGITNGKRYSVRRRYIDFNRFSFKNHSNTCDATFDTPGGQSISREICRTRKKLQLDTTFGCAPHDFYMNRQSATDVNNVFHLLTEHVFPDMVINPARENKSRMIFTNSGAIRFDIFKGPFTLDSSFMLCPFRSHFLYIRDVDYSKAKNVLRLLNFGRYADSHSVKLRGLYQVANSVNTVYARKRINIDQLAFTKRKERITPGHTTHDDYGQDGDDTMHSKVPFYPITNCIQALGSFPESSDPVLVDVVFADFVAGHVIDVLSLLGASYTLSDVEPYLGSDDTLSSVMRNYTSKHWKCC